jgi:phosphomannomutase / phosphoglucomutase
VEDVVKAEGGEVVYTRVGSPVVARKMIEVGAIFGGEENGGLIFPEHQYCRDGGMTAAKMLEIVASEGPMSKLLSKIPEYYLDKRKMKCPEDRKEAVLELIVEAFSKERVDTTDGVKVYFNEGWTLIRPSGTEPIFRIFSEAKSVESAKRCGDRCEKALREILE